MALNWSDRCCICGRIKPSYHNPEPLRDGVQDCCDDCNRLVIRARMKGHPMTKDEYEAYVLRLRGMTYRELTDELGEEGF